jgi:butyryl-CoA dehydrogenase
MLLAQKAYAEGALALNLYCARLVDELKIAPDDAGRLRAQQLLDLLTPIAKSWPSQWCLEANSLAIQVLGGYGYTREYPVEQHWRDNRLNMIHEGTHGIQALDLLGRKVVQDGGVLLHRLAQEMAATCARAAASGDAEPKALSEPLQRAACAVHDATQALWASGSPALALSHATGYLQAFGHTVVAWIWLDLLVTACDRGSAAAAGVTAACRYFFSHELPHVAAWLAPAQSGDPLLIDTPEDAL